MRYLLLIVLLLAIFLDAGCVQTHPIPSKITTKPTTSECYYANSVEGYDSCNGICWDWKSQTCCGGVIYNVPMKENVCCGGKLYPYQSGWECCPATYLKRWTNSTQDNSQVWFNTSTHHCCGGKVTIGGGSTGWYGTTRQWQECGNSCYDTGTQSCCRFWKQENNDTFAVYTVKEGRRSCCLNLTFQIPENNRCNPEDGSITQNNTGMGDNCKGFLDGSIRCLGPGQRWS